MPLKYFRNVSLYIQIGGEDRSALGSKMLTSDMDWNGLQTVWDPQALGEN